MADGDYERGRAHEIGAYAARLRAWRAERAAAKRPPRVFVLNGWAAAPEAWSLCAFPRERIFSYTEQLAGVPEACLASLKEPFVLVGWSMGGSTALRLACRFPQGLAGLVLLAATPHMMEEKETGWCGMTPRRLEAFEFGLKVTHGAGLFGVPEGKPNPYMMDTDENLKAGLRYLLETDVREDVRRARIACPVYVFQSEHDGIVRSAHADFLKAAMPQAVLRMIPGTEHALPILIPEEIDSAVNSLLRKTS